MSKLFSQNQGPHCPVLLKESVDLLDIRPGLIYVDATAGAGGHLQEIISRFSISKLGVQDKTYCPNTSTTSNTIIGLDCDPSSIAALRNKFGDRATLVHTNFLEITKALSELGITTITGGILADLGMSSVQLDNPARGFSFLKDGPLDMRMDCSKELTAEKLVNHLPEQELAQIIFKFGEERHNRKIAREIVRQRPLYTTTQLANLISKCVSYKRNNRDNSHPATRTFQALRIAVNNELDNLQKFMRQALTLLAPGARLAIITFHSLEDRLVKQFFRQASLDCLCPPRQPMCTCNHKRKFKILTNKPIVANPEEVLANIRSRSAKLRVVEKLP